MIITIFGWSDRFYDSQGYNSKNTLLRTAKLSEYHANSQATKLATAKQGLSKSQQQLRVPHTNKASTQKSAAVNFPPQRMTKEADRAARKEQRRGQRGEHGQVGRGRLGQRVRFWRSHAVPDHNASNNSIGFFRSFDSEVFPQERVFAREAMVQPAKSCALRRSRDVGNGDAIEVNENARRVVDQEAPHVRGGRAGGSCEIDGNSCWLRQIPRSVNGSFAVQGRTNQPQFQKIKKVNFKEKLVTRSRPQGHSHCRAVTYALLDSWQFRIRLLCHRQRQDTASWSSRRNERLWCEE